MATKKRKNNKISGTKIKKNDRKELFLELLPLFKSFGIWIILVVIVAWDYTNYRWFSMLFIHYTTLLTYALAKIMFIPAVLLGSGTTMMTTIEVNYRLIMISDYPMMIELECSAYHAYIALIALVAFSKWKLKPKLVAGSILFMLLSVINSLRIIILGVIGKKFPQVFDLMHDYIWNILLVVVIWGLWELTNQKLSNKKNEAISS
jgi:exosortase/archaeosortase family protein